MLYALFAALFRAILISLVFPTVFRSSLMLNFDIFALALY